MAIVMRDKGCMLSSVGFYLVIVGAVNWGLVGLGHFMNADWNLVHMILGSWPAVEAIVYIIVGVAGVMTLIGCKCSTCKACRVEAGAKV